MSQSTQGIAPVMFEGNHLPQDNEVAALHGSRVSVTKCFEPSMGVWFLRLQAAGHFSRSVVFPQPWMQSLRRDPRAWRSRLSRQRKNPSTFRRVLSHWCKVFVARCGVLLASCCGSGSRRCGVLGADCCGSGSRCCGRPRCRLLRQRSTQQYRRCGVTARVCSCGAVPGQSVDTLKELGRTTSCYSQRGSMDRSGADRLRLERWFVVAPENYWVRLENFRRWISCTSRCTKVDSLHFHSHGMEVTDALRELETP